MHKFQSSPGPRAGSNLAPTLIRPSTRCFNPLPAREPGATFAAVETIFCTSGRFNPLPAREPGATVAIGNTSTDVRPRFQSSPGPRAGSNHIMRNASTLVGSSFNPLPAREPGATKVVSTAANATGFNPLPAREPGATLMARPKDTETIMFQSSPGPRAGSNCVRSRRI